MVRSLRLFSIVAILGVVAALVLPACGQGVSPSAYQAPVEKQPQCTATAVAGTLICIDGNGNVIYIGAPTPTPTPSGSPSATACNAEPSSIYSDNVVNAGRGIVPSSTTAAAMPGYIIQLRAAIEKGGFKTTSGGTLPSDEIAVKITDALSETFDVWRADNVPQVLYQETCRPARF